MDTKRLLDMMDSRKEELFGLLTSLVRINSESFGDSGREEACVQYIEAFCRDLGLHSDVFSPLELENFTELSPEASPTMNWWK